jgi:hypothetical protein
MNNDLELLLQSKLKMSLQNYSEDSIFQRYYNCWNSNLLRQDGAVNGCGVSRKQIYRENNFSIFIETQDIITFGGNWALFGRRRSGAGAGFATFAGRA